ncbi:VOC family protein [Bacillus sp. V59.32b]|uniref:VOC family protein n=1 Tax=Bacillus sp. V59.32b TaxID=1758642 RepID=UPI00135C33C7|nr:VOC family protein [Bacillus sp. V59.32b]
MKFHHIALEVKDIEVSRSFYQDYLGLEEETQFELMGGKIAFLTLGNLRIELIQTQDSEHVTSGRIHLCFEVKDMEHALIRLIKDGYYITEGPYFLANGWKTFFSTGPDAEILEFLEISRD